MSTRLPNCLDCSKQLSKPSYKRCIPCANASPERNQKLSKSLSGSKSRWWKGGWKTKLKCIDCGDQLRRQGAQRCKVCYGISMSGSNHPNWHGGVTSSSERIRKSKEYVLWRTAVFMRDDYTCQKCGQVGGTLHADHKKPFSLYPELRLAIDNGRTLCKPCHLQTDTWGTKALLYKEVSE